MKTFQLFTVTSIICITPHIPKEQGIMLAVAFGVLALVAAWKNE